MCNVPIVIVIYKTPVPHVVVVPVVAIAAVGVAVVVVLGLRTVGTILVCVVHLPHVGRTEHSHFAILFVLFVVKHTCPMCCCCSGIVACWS